MDEPPFVGVHRLELERTAGNAYALRQFAHSLHDPIFAHGAIVFAIDDDFFGVLVSGLQQTIELKLNGLQRLAVASDEPPAFLGVKL